VKKWNHRFFQTGAVAQKLDQRAIEIDRPLA
jgi:hypothetical protein